MSFAYSTLPGHEPRLPMFVTPLYQPYPLPPRSRRNRIRNLTPMQLKNMAEEMASLSEEEYDYDNEVLRDTQKHDRELSDTLSISSDKSFGSMVMASCSRSEKLQHSMKKWYAILCVDYNCLTRWLFESMAGK